MTIVDGHVHVGLTKYVPVEVLVAQMEVAGIDKALLVQYGGCCDNAYLARCRERYPGRFAALGAVDYHAPDAAARVRSEIETHGLAGVRISAAVNREDVWESIADLGAMASLSGGMEAIVAPEMAARIERFPKATFRLEHMGWLRDLDRSPNEPPFAQLMEYARLPNVILMLSGFYASGKRYPYPEAEPFVQRALERFGASRLMWGSDFPPVTGSETCRMALDMPRQWDFVSEEQLRWILGGTALRVLDFRAAGSTAAP